MYSPEYAVNDMIEAFEKLAKEGKLPEEVNTYLLEAWKEIEAMESCMGYGVPRRTKPLGKGCREYETNGKSEYRQVR